MLLKTNWETPDGCLVLRAVWTKILWMRYLLATMNPNLKPGANNLEKVSNLMTLPDVSICVWVGTALGVLWQDDVTIWIVFDDDDVVFLTDGVHLLSLFLGLGDTGWILTGWDTVEGLWLGETLVVGLIGTPVVQQVLQEGNVDTVVEVWIVVHVLEVDLDWDVDTAQVRNTGVERSEGEVLNQDSGALVDEQVGNLVQGVTGTVGDNNIPIVVSWLVGLLDQIAGKLLDLWETISLTVLEPSGDGDFFSWVFGVTVGGGSVGEFMDLLLDVDVSLVGQGRFLFVR
ncbi:hypothetical protein WICPIJ_008325 [Wickerhamomyces pijperi]|uniref:Uncharacterized protein n=1 Tax=Wickerhamomyces pijperi TaxID=599730 RepID=A0A9P8Q009_WICPI|nr:hypothetical protein WICPIJ_008325 [Wickerhamomyces pijperi]